MEFRDLKKQYQSLKEQIDDAMLQVAADSNFISGKQVTELEHALAEYVGVRHCISCANGTDALSIAMMAWGVGPGDAVFVPDFTFFASAEIVSLAGATPIFVDVNEETFNMSPDSLQNAIEFILKEGKLIPKVVISVDLFGQPADYTNILPIVRKYNLKLLEDAAQGFGGMIGNKKACSFGDISTTSFFPAKPLGCYGDGGAIFTDNDEIDILMRSLCIHGKGEDKYDNVRIGMNSRIDTIQAAILNVKLNAFKKYELKDVNEAALYYTQMLERYVQTPKVQEGFYSSWAQYSILMKSKEQRDELQELLKSKGIPSMIYYKKPMHLQSAFANIQCSVVDLSVTESACNRILSLPMHPYITKEDQNTVIEVICSFFNE